MPRELEAKQKKHKSIEKVEKRRIEPSKRVGQNIAPIRTVLMAKATLSAFKTRFWARPEPAHCQGLVLHS